MWIVIPIRVTVLPLFDFEFKGIKILIVIQKGKYKKLKLTQNRGVYLKYQQICGN